MKIADLEQVQPYEVPRIMRAWTGKVVHIIDRRGNAPDGCFVYITKCNRVIRYTNSFLPRDAIDLHPCERCGSVADLHRVWTEETNWRLQMKEERQKTEEERRCLQEIENAKIRFATDRLRRILSDVFATRTVEHMVGLTVSEDAKDSRSFLINFGGLRFRVTHEIGRGGACDISSLLP